MTRKLIENINPHEITIATLCSHTSLQIFHGARIEGFKTLGITVGKKYHHSAAWLASRIYGSSELSKFRSTGIWQPQGA